MNPAKELKDNLLHINRLRKYVGFSTIFMAVKSELKLTIVDSVSAKRILVLAPHPDDDIFGCGGTLALYQKAGSTITVLNMTNGKDSNRRSESSKACNEIGVCDVRFWDNQDGKLVADKSSVSKLSEIITETRPELIFTPSFFDIHNDHVATTKILAIALEKIEFDGEIYSYEIWQPLFANRLVTIDSVIEQKKSAITAHQSQLKDRDYLSAILGLNQYRAGMFNAGCYAEAFFSSKKDLYLKRYHVINS